MPKHLPEKLKTSLERVQNQLGHSLEKLRSKTIATKRPEALTSDAIPGFMQSGVPRLELREEANGLVVTAELPGLNKEDFSVELSGERLTIRAEKQLKQEERGPDGSFYSEQRYGSFARSVQLPYAIDEAKVVAELKNGILTLRLPRSGTAPPRKHKVPIT